MSEFRRLESDAVVRLADEMKLLEYNTGKVSDLLAALYKLISYNRQIEMPDSGLKCESLSPGGEWQGGRVRFVMEFCPNEHDQSE